MDDFRLDTRLELKSTESGSEWGRFSGVASTADEDLGGDVVDAGAFEPIHAPHVAMLLGHDAAAPIGKWESLGQVAGRLVARGAIKLSLQKGREAYEMIRDGIVTGLSIGFRTEPGAVSVDARGKRRIRKGQLLEISLVTVPMNGACRITDVRSFAPVDVAERLNRVTAQWETESGATRTRLLDLEIQIAEAIAAKAAAGELAETKAADLIRQIRDGMR